MGQTNIGTVSKVTFWENSERRVVEHMGFSERIDTIFELNSMVPRGQESQD